MALNLQIERHRIRIQNAIWQLKKDSQRRSLMRKQEGFSLIELLIVFAIILIIAAIAVPSLIRARVSANESAAAANTRTIITSEVQYHTTFGSYSPNLTSLGPPAGGCPSATHPRSN